MIIYSERLNARKFYILQKMNKFLEKKFYTESEWTRKMEQAADEDIH